MVEEVYFKVFEDDSFDSEELVGQSAIYYQRPEVTSGQGEIERQLDLTRGKVGAMFLAGWWMGCAGS